MGGLLALAQRRPDDVSLLALAVLDDVPSWNDHIERMCRRRALVLEAPGRDGRCAAAGLVDGVWVRVSVVSTRAHIAEVGLGVIEVKTDVPIDISLAPRLDAPSGPPIGDPLLDDKVVATGPRAEVLSRLPAPTRDAVVAVVAGGAVLAGGVLRCGGIAPDRLDDVLDALVRAAVALQRPAPIEPALTVLALLDPLPAFRAHALDALATHDPAHALATAERLLCTVGADPTDARSVRLRATSPDPDLAVAAAIVLQARGDPRSLIALRTGAVRHPALNTFTRALEALHDQVALRTGGLALSSAPGRGSLSDVEPVEGHLTLVDPERT